MLIVIIIYLLQQVDRCDTVLSCIAVDEFNQAAVLSIPHLFIIQLEYLPINCLIWVHTHSILSQAILLLDLHFMVFPL